jgi:hypothetical protein
MRNLEVFMTGTDQRVSSNNSNNKDNTLTCMTHSISFQSSLVARYGAPMKTAAKSFLDAISP